MSRNVLVVGAGMTGALTASMAQRKLPEYYIRIWDKARGVGGRMTTSRSPTNSSCTADIGAQYFSINNDIALRNRNVLSTLINNHIIEELDVKMENFRDSGGARKHYYAPNGTGSVVKHFTDLLPKKLVELSHKVVQIDEDNDQFIVRSESGDVCKADAVILTMPVPQIFDIKGSIAELVNSNIELSKIKYSSRFALVWFYDKSVNFPNVDWACKYLDHEIFCFVSIDNYKRNKKDGPASVVFHTNTKFGAEYIDKHLGEVESVLAKSAKELFPDWPEPDSVKYHKWRYSQVTNPFEGFPGLLTLKNKPILLVGGDAFAEPNFEGCLKSSKFIVDTLISLVKLE